LRRLISGKVRDVYEAPDNNLIIVTSDRISAFDVILSKPVEGKGKVLNAISLFWFVFTKDIIKNHIISADLGDMPGEFQSSEFEGRAVLTKRLKMLPFECVVRGYIFGHMWEGYEEKREFCGQKLDGEYKLAQKLEKPLFTPSTKAQEGHDEYVSVDRFEETLGRELADKVRDISLRLYEVCYDFAYSKGMIIADVKFEFGLDKNNELVLADELCTPDSSRFWSLDDYEVGVSPKSYDKQFVRDWLQNNLSGGEMQFDNVPDEILEKTADIYKECLRKLTEPAS